MPHDRRSALGRGLRALALVSSALALPASAHAVNYVRSVEYVELSLGAGVTNASLILTKGQNAANCVPFATAAVTGTDANYQRVFTDVFFQTAPTRVSVQRSVGTGSVSVGVFVVEFDPAYVNVQQGTFAMANLVPTANAGITGVSLARAALLSYYQDGSASGSWSDFAVAGWFSLANQLSWQRNTSVGALSGHWYVFEARNAEFSVQAVSFSVPNTVSIGTALISAVDLDKTSVLASYRTAYGSDDSEDGQIGVFLSNPTTLTARRQFQNSGGPSAITDIRAFVVQWGGGVRVQHGALSYADTDMQRTATIEAVNLPFSMVWNGVALGPGMIECEATSGGDGDSGFQRLKLANATTLRGDRGESCAGGDCEGVGSFEVVDFEPPGRMLVKSGSYTGNGSDDRRIHVGFRPDAVFVKRAGADPQVYAVLRTSTMTGDQTKWLQDAPGGIALAPNLIQSLDATGFSVGTDPAVNENLTEYHWVAFRAASGQMTVGTYTGNGSAGQSITSPRFQPEYVIVLPPGGGDPDGIPVSVSSTFPSDTSFDFDGSQRGPGAIVAMEMDGFRVGSLPLVNTNGVTYHYIAWNALPGRMAVGSYPGDGFDDRNIDVVGFQPEWVLIKKHPPGATSRAWTTKPASTGVSVDASIRFSDTGTGGVVADDIQALRPLGFQVGTSDRVNTGAGGDCGAPPCTYHWVAFGPHLPQVNYRSIGTAPSYGTGVAAGAGTGVSVTNGSAILAGVGGATWLSANRGRGDVITIPCDNPPVCTLPTPGVDYQILKVDSETQLQLRDGYAGGTAGSVSYLIRRQFSTLQAWEDCISFNSDGGAGSDGCIFFDVASASLVADDRSEIGIAYNDSIPASAADFTAGVKINGGPANTNTDATHTITLTADPGNRHHGIPGAGVRVTNPSATQTVWIMDDYVAVEWLELESTTAVGGIYAQTISPGSGTTAASRLVIRNNLIHGAPGSGFGINLDDGDEAADVYNNIVYSLAIHIRIVSATLSPWARIRILNNTMYDYGVSGFDSSVTTLPQQITLINNIAVDPQGAAQTSFAAALYNFNPASRNNLSSDTLAGPAFASPGGGGIINQDYLNDVDFVNTGVFNLHIQGTSTAANAGTDLGSIFIADIDAAARQTPWDIGADDVVATTEVDLLSFAAVGLSGAVELLWETASETNNLGFYLYRSESGTGRFERITPSPIPGLGSSPVGARYRYVDQGVVNGRSYSYLLEDYETTGKTKRHGPVSATPQPGASSPGGGSEPASGPGPGPSRVIYGNPDDTSLRILERTRHGLLLELATGGFYAEPQPDGSVRLSIPGFTEENAPGSPAIPVRRAWIEAVAGRKVQLASVRALDVAAYSSLRPLAAEVREVVASRSGALRLARRRQDEGRLFRRKGLYPGVEARLLETAFQGETKKALLELAPLRWDPRTGELLLARRLQVRLSFAGVEPAERSAGGLRGRRYQERRSHQRRGVIARLSTEQKGLYAVRYEDIVTHGGGLEASGLALSRRGSPVAFHLEPDRRRFGPGSALYFWSEGASANPYGNRAVYELELAETSGLLMPTASAAPRGALLDTHVSRLEREENVAFAAQLQIENFWVWASMLASTSKSFAFDASRVVPGPARLELWLLGVTATPDAVEHRVRLFVNGHFVAEPTWTSAAMESLSVELQPSLLQEGPNTLTIENANSFYSAVMLDRFAVSYPRVSVAEAGVLEGRFSSSGSASISGLAATPIVLDLSSETPRWLSGALCAPGSCRFAVEANHAYFVAQAPLRPFVELATPGRLKNTAFQHDYIVIGPQALLDAAEPLLEQRRSQGLSSLAVSIEEIYDEFGFGEPAPSAIRDFVAYAFQKWAAPAPRYVLLLGDGSFDYKDYLKLGTGNPVPPVLFRSSFIWTAADPLFAAVNGEDSLPDLALGRLPASTPEEARAMVEKILAFENAGLNLDGPAVLVTDNPDNAGNFDAEADEIATTLLASRNPSRISLAALGKDAARAAILDAFDQGPSLLSYLGHGSQQLWAHENIFHASQVPSLSPQAQQPFVLTMNCLNGYFHYPHYDSLSEELVKAEGKGAIAAFSPSGLSFNDAAHVFHKAFLAELTQASHPRLGDALLAAQAAYADTGASPEMIDIYHLLGDPALRIR